MKFCEKCEGIMLPKDEGRLSCIGCGSLTEGKISFEQKVDLPNKGVGFVPEINPLASYENICAKCGFDKAEAIIKEPAISDEDHIVMLRCGKCGLVENLTRKMF
jgi:DNA-directed RNA polymerase subunit M/transcription elongation factor TFIIS